MRWVFSAFIFRLPRGQQREQPHRAIPTDLRGPCGALDALIVPRHSGIKPLSDANADASLRFCERCAGFAPASTVLSRSSTLELASQTCRDVRVQWCRNLLGCAMPHASGASRAGLHSTPRLQDDVLAGLAASRSSACHLGFCPPALACKVRTGGLPLSLRCRCLA